jgi:hypothetical protein
VFPRARATEREAAQMAPEARSDGKQCGCLNPLGFSSAAR